MNCTACRSPSPRRYALWATWIVLLGAGLRMFRLLDQSIWYDEAFDVLYAQKPVSGIDRGSVSGRASRTGACRSATIACLGDLAEDLSLSRFLGYARRCELVPRD